MFNEDWNLEMDLSAKPSLDESHQRKILSHKKLTGALIACGV